MRQQQSEHINELAKALATAQLKMNGVEKKADNPFFKSKYSELSDVWKACKEPLCNEGIAVMQTVDFDEQGSFLVTTLAHSSGQWMKSFYPLLLVKKDSQGMGAAITYARRYALQAMVGLAAIDDDGESTVGISSREKEVLMNAIGEDKKLLAHLYKKFETNDLGTISRGDYASTMEFIKTRNQKGNGHVNERTA